MADDIQTPVAAGKTFAFKDVGARLFPWSLLADTAGADAMGTVSAAPATYTLLGRLKAIADAVLSLVGLTSGADNFKVLTAGTATLNPVPKAIYVTGAGTITAEGADGVAVVFTFDDRSSLAIRPRRITAATATGIVGLY